MGGLGITILSKQVDQEYQSSQLVTSVLQDQILMQDETYSYEIIAEQMWAKTTMRNTNKDNSSKATRDLMELLPDSLQRSVKLASEKGSSTWLTVLPLSEHGFALHKGAFQDSLAFYYFYYYYYYY